VILEVAGLAHHLDGNVFSGGEAKHRGFRLGELVFPRVLEVNGRRQNHRRAPSDAACGLKTKITLKTIR